MNKESKTIPEELPTISIIMPSFNQSRYLEYAIKSIIDQDYPKSKVEFIVMDGGSTDGSLDILQYYEAEFSFWQSRPDGGQANAINLGMQRAEGEIVAWLNSDDLYLPGVFTEVAALMTNSDIDATSANAYHWDVKRKKLFLVKGLSPDLFTLKLFGNFIAQPTCFWRKKTWVNIGGLNAKLFRYLDYDLQLRLIQKEVKYQYVDRARTIILWHGENKCATLNLENEWEEITRLHDLYSRIIQRTLGKIFIGYRHLKEGHTDWIVNLMAQKYLHGKRKNLLGLEIESQNIKDHIGEIWRDSLSEII